MTPLTSIPFRAVYKLPRGLVWPPMLFFLLILLFSSCASVKVPPRSIRVVVRELHTRRPLAGVQLTLTDTTGKPVAPVQSTDALGYAEFRRRELKAVFPHRGELPPSQLQCTHTFQAGSHRYTLNETVRINPFVPLLDLYLDSLDRQSTIRPVPNAQRVADMHYHVSMRGHNLFGHWLYADDRLALLAPENLNWYKDFRKLRVLYNGRWRRPYLGPTDPARVGNSKRRIRREETMYTLLNEPWVRPRPSANMNFLTHYTQATHPHMLEGGVFLAFNAISPFEHNVGNTAQKRFVNRNFVTGAPPGWLKRIGGDKQPFTHWQNFQYEYATLARQSNRYNRFGWRYYEYGMDLAADIPTIVNVVEGSHILQDRLFPHELQFDLCRRASRENRNLFNKIIAAGDLTDTAATRSYARIRFEQLVDSLLLDTLMPAEGRPVLARLREPLPQPVKGDWDKLGTVVHDSLTNFIDELLLRELMGNIDALKRMQQPPICMMTIAHLTYNGMVGHAPNLDGGKFLTNIIARKNYNIRVSDDPMYRNQWAGAFFTVPGVNKFGRAVIDGLISRENGPRIFIDLKHSDFFTRKYFFEEVMIDTVLEKRLPAGTVVVQDGRQDVLPKELVARDTTLLIPPICSHCAVTGLPSPYYSPLSDEYSLLRSPSTTTFYPFGINLYDEEIATICTNDGIIGIPLEQRVLGGYINTRRHRPYDLDRRGNLDRHDAMNIRRWKEVKRWLTHFLVEEKPVLDAAIRYTRDSMGVAAVAGKTRLQQHKRILRITYEDYVSAEPFLQNLFYLIDHSGLDPRQAWNHVCLGSDLDGLIDPIDLCPTASHYPKLRSRLRQFIPLFLQIRAEQDASGQSRTYAEYFSADFTLEAALDKLFYESLRDFTARYLVHPASGSQNPTP